MPLIISALDNYGQSSIPYAVDVIKFFMTVFSYFHLSVDIAGMPVASTAWDRDQMPESVPCPEEGNMLSLHEVRMSIVAAHYFRY